MPNGGIFIDVGCIGAIVFRDNFGAAATAEDAGYCG
jgi:hypothetical protein